MKRNYALTLAALGLAACLPPAYAQLVIPSDGSDGALNLPSSPTNVVIDLSQAVTGNWNNNNGANAGKGIYDASKWAVVFKYSSVNIPAGVRVTFTNHASRAPVVWLVAGNVTIDGMVDLSGESVRYGIDALVPSEPGPGGFRGAARGPQGNGAGLGPGGGTTDNVYAKDAGYARAYGNPNVLPLIGGSGGSAATSLGSAGGGAILIAASGDFTVSGTIWARGGWFGNRDWDGKGSGGAIRIVASHVAGSGELNCLSGTTDQGTTDSGGNGRIRIEAGALASSLHIYPETVRVSPATPPLIWASDATPTVSIVAVSTNAAPADPTAPLTSNADVAIELDTATTITLETHNFPIEGTVQVRAAQKWGNASWINAAYVSGNQASATWRATTTFVKGYTTLQARATAP